MRRTTHPARHRQGISLVEVSVSTLLVGLLVVSALRSVAGATQAADSSAARTEGMLLAENMMEEILQQDYAEPTDSAVFGIEGSEAAGNRTGWDDVDDYDQWTASPPQRKNGTTVVDAEWTRSVVVEFVAADDFSDTRADTEETGVKKITVVVSHNNHEVARLVSIQTQAWISMIPQSGESTTTGQLPPANEAPNAAFSQTFTSGSGTISISFSAATSSDPENDPLEYNWSFSDGDESTGQNTNHVFTNTSEYTLVFQATLTVQDIHGATDTATTSITVYPAQ